MRWIVGLILILAIGAGAGYSYLSSYPYKRYSQWITGKGHDHFYEIKDFKNLYLVPAPLLELPPYQEDYVQLWKEFPLRNSLIPLPTRHPMFQTVPLIESQNKDGIPQLGVILLDPKGREISRVYSLPNALYQDHSQGQDLFKLPFVRKRILNKSVDDLWKDVFSYKIVPKEKSIDEMIYDLYILHIRSKILPKETLRYGLIKEGKQAMIEIDSPDKDYTVEIVLTQDSGSIFSYILKTEKNNSESLKLRAKFLNSISFSPIDETNGKFLYTEFKQLNFARQVDQEGMLYLFTAWSQNPDNVEFLKEMIYYLERGQNTKRQLKALYNYSFNKYGKTFATRKDIELDDENLSLQRKIEIEAKDNLKAAEANQGKAPEVPELTADEKMNLYLKRAKEEKSNDAQDMVVH